MAFSYRELVRRESSEGVFVSLLLLDASASDVAFFEAPRQGRILRIRAESTGASDKVLPEFIDADTPPVAAYGLSEIGICPGTQDDEVDSIASIVYFLSGSQMGVRPGGNASNDTIRIDVWIAPHWRGA